MHPVKSTNVGSTLLLLLGLVALSVAPVRAETVIVESRTTNTVSTITPNPPYLEGPSGWSSSGSKSSAGGTTASRPGSRFGFSGTPSVTITPTLVAGANYSMDTTHISVNASPNIVVNITYSGCSGTAASTATFNNTVNNSWTNIGIISVDPGVTQPSITFTYASGTLASTGGRWYVDAFRFVNQSDPCVSSLSEIATVNGPLAAGQTFVDVPNVTAGATAVTVYADGQQIGRKTNNISAGVNRVTTSPLVKGTQVTATQSNDAGVESCRPTTGPIVGGGANPRVRIALSIKQDVTLTGPIGANAGVSTLPLKFLGATNNINGNAPAGSKVFYPSNDWQTVSLLRGDDPANPVDPTFVWAQSDGTSQLKGDFGILDSIDFAIDDLTDTGPFQVYIDNLVNGDTLIQGFEAAANGTSGVLFLLPNFSGSSAQFLLAQPPGAFTPNLSVVTNGTSDTGVQSLLVSWQFKDTLPQDWLRLVAQGSGTPNPQVDLRLPISFRMLLLPAGQTIGQTAPMIFGGPQSQTVVEGGSTTLSVTARGAPPLHFQWRFNGSPIDGATNNSLTLSNVQSSSAGNYSLVITNSLGTTNSTNAALTVISSVFSQVMTPLWQLTPGTRPYLANDNNSRGIAYDPIGGNLLVLSRSGSNAVHVLDGLTGAYLHSLTWDANLITGGTLAANMICVADDGVIYVGNLTQDGTTNEFRLYTWAFDDSSVVPILAWHGDPGAGVRNRWGDTLAVRGSSGFHEILLGSRNGTAVSLLMPDLGDTSPPHVINVADASPGNFGLGVCFGAGNTFWGKANGGASLRHVAFDPGADAGTTLASFTGFPNMGPIGTDAARSLLAGVSIETPDNLRLFDTSNNGLVNIDTEFFPADNANANGTGSLAFGPDLVYALDSNNGLIAMSLNTACLPDRLNIQRSGQNIVLSWTRSTHRLQRATALANPDSATSWTDVAGASPVTISASSGNRFFRLVCP